MFCELCGKILNVNSSENKLLGACSCGFIKEINSDFSFTEVIKNNNIGSGVLDQNDLLTSGFPHTCSKCGYSECDIDDLGVQIGDESNIILYRCKKCKYVERQADGSGNN